MTALLKESHESRKGNISKSSFFWPEKGVEHYPLFDKNRQLFA
jgi:hypothetical protein